MQAINKLNSGGSVGQKAVYLPRENLFHIAYTNRVHPAHGPLPFASQPGTCLLFPLWCSRNKDGGDMIRSHIFHSKVMFVAMFDKSSESKCVLLSALLRLSL